MAKIFTFITPDELPSIYCNFADRTLIYKQTGRRLVQHSTDLN
jgi:hypothetical protein